MIASIEQFAAENNLDAGALKSLVGFLTRRMNDSETLRAAFIANPDEVLKAGVKAWHDQSTKLFTELLENRTEWARAAREQMAYDTWYQIRTEAGLPTD